MKLRRVSIAIGIGLALSGCQSFPQLFDSDLSSKQVREIADEITVIIDSCGSAGSGVVFKKDGNTYSVLTANHVVNKAKGTCIILTSDQIEHETLVSKAIVPVPDVDLAVLTFVSNKTYKLAKMGDSDKATKGTMVYVAGAPEVNEGIPERTTLTPDGKIIGLQRESSKVEGHTLIYDNNTRRGMSGGPVLNQKGEVIGIHGRGQNEYAIRGENFGIPINKFLAANLDFIYENSSVYWIALFHGTLFIVKLSILVLIIAGVTYLFYYLYRQNQAKKALEYVTVIGFYIVVGVVLITFFLGGRGIVDLFYYIEGNVRNEFGDYPGAIAAYNRAININPNYANAYIGRGIAYYKKKNYHDAMASYYWSIYFSNGYYEAYLNRGITRSALGDEKGANADYYRAAIEKNNSDFGTNYYYICGFVHSLVGNDQQAIEDYHKSRILKDFSPK